MQQGLFDLTIEDFRPRDEVAHLKKIGFDSTGTQYAVKRIEDGNWIPLSEWIGYSLSRKVGIATPDFAIGYDDTQTPVFCSKWEKGKIFYKDDTDMDILAEITTRLQFMMNVITLDEFIENPDRHLGNFIFTEQSPTLLSYDFSLLQLTRTACGAHIDRSKKDQTQQTKRLIEGQALRVKTKLDNQETKAKIKALTKGDLEAVLTACPNIWMQQAGIDCIIDYLLTKQEAL